MDDDPCENSRCIINGLALCTEIKSKYGTRKQVGDNCEFSVVIPSDVVGKLEDLNLHCNAPMDELISLGMSILSNSIKHNNQYCNGSYMDYLREEEIYSINRSFTVVSISNIDMISQALEAYYNDNGVYPDTNDNFACLVKDENNLNNSMYNSISNYLKGNEIPKANYVRSGAPCEKSYYYMSLNKDGIENNAYVLASYISLYSKANFNVDNLLKIAGDNSLTTYSYVQDNITSFNKEFNDFSKFLYIHLGG